MKIVLFYSNLNRRYKAYFDNEYYFFWFDRKTDILKGILYYYNVEEIVIPTSLINDFKSIYKDVFTKAIIKTIEADSEIEYYPSVNLIASNDTHINLFSTVIKKQPERFNLFTSKLKFENAINGAKDNHLEIGLIFCKIPLNKQHLPLVVANDWGPAEKLIIQYNANNTATFCLQESIIDFKDKYKRMQWVQYPLFQGAASLKLLLRKVNFIVGNPKFENLERSPLPSNTKAFINVNFTYGFPTRDRYLWISNVMDCIINKFNLSYLISQHPRDTTDLQLYQFQSSSAFKVHDMIRECSFVITRFSSIVHEAIIIGRPVIYYNPHNEVIGYDFEFNNKFLFYSQNIDQLNSAVKFIIGAEYNIDDYNKEIKNYLLRHIGRTNYSHYPSEIITEAVSINYRSVHSHRFKLTLNEYLRNVRSFIKYLIKK